jgi:hypothetical protein
MPKTFLLTAKEIKRKIVNYENKIVISLLFFFFVFYCYLGTLPKHGDFWGIIAPGNPFLTGSIVYYNPLVGIFFRVWIKIGSIFLPLNLNTWVMYHPGSFSEPHIIQNWCIIPFLLMLLFWVIISYVTLKNKWLTFICFGTFSFVSIIIMGQVDIWDAFWIYVAMILALKSLESEDNLKYIFSSVFALGLSMQLKPFGGLIFPVFFVFFLVVLQKKPYAQWIKYTLLFYATLEFIFISFAASIIWPQFTSSPSGEAIWLFNFQLTSLFQNQGYHIILIWLFGYILILYDLWVNFQSNGKNYLNKFFIFYIFAVIAWFFITVYTLPQWWMLLVPPLLLLLDNFEQKFNYVFYVIISILFLFFTLQWGPMTSILWFYIPVIDVTPLFVSIVVTLISAILFIWIFELRKSLFINLNEEHLPIKYNGVLIKITPILTAILIIFLFLFILICGQTFLPQYLGTYYPKFFFDVRPGSTYF